MGRECLCDMVTVGASDGEPLSTEENGMPCLLLVVPDAPDRWVDAFRAIDPALELRVWPDAGRAAEIDYAYVWQPPRGLLAGLPKLKAIFSLGAGCDHILADPTVPAGLPISRVVDPELTQRMTEYVCLAVLYLHRNWPAILRAQAETRWQAPRVPVAGERRVGVMGMGVLGGAAARALATLGFDAAGWSRRRREGDDLTGFSGANELMPFLARSQILVCLLPLTAETAGILDARAFAALPEGAGLVNAARGGHLIDSDLLAALDDGQLGHAVLDVFAEEPLPPDHPFWQHPRVTVTPHMASLSSRPSRARLVVDGIRRVEAGLPPCHLIDRARGY